MYKFLPNYDEHPTKSNYMVFTFRDFEMANYFEEELTKRNLFFESSEEVTRHRFMYYYEIKKSDKAEVYQLNLITHGKFRKAYFGNKYLRIILTALLIGLVTLAIIGFIKN